jgi:hypothetical protein
MSELSKRARFILKKSSAWDLLKRGFTWFIFDHGIYDLYEHRVADIDASLFSPVLPGYKYKIARNNTDADELAREYEDFRNVIFDARRMLDKNAVAFCIYSGKELAHVTWLAFDPKAQKAIYAMPYKVDFSNAEACVGGTYTDPKFRGKGLMVYGNHLKFKYLKGIGIKVLKHAIKTDNPASITGYARFSPMVKAKCRYFKLFGFRYWKESPVQDQARP